MKQQIYPEMSRKERKEAMKKACYRVEYEAYQATLPTDELSAEQDAYSRRAIELQKVKKELADYNKKKKAEIKAIEEEMAVQLEVINTGQREIEGNLYMFQDLQTNDMNYFDANGMWVRSRKIRPEERQTTMSIGASDVAVTDTERDEQEIEDAVATDVTTTEAGNYGTVKEGFVDDKGNFTEKGTASMPSEYGAMSNNNAGESMTQIAGETVMHGHNDEPAANTADANEGGPEVDTKQQEAEEKLAAHKRNKSRMSKKQKGDAFIPAKHIPAIDETQQAGAAETSQEDEDFNLPK